MASFSFGAGNAGKILRIPLYALGRAATLVVPRTSDVWVFGSAVGLADGGLALQRFAADRGERTLWLTGSAGEGAEARRLGIRSVAKHSLRGFWATARARVIVITHGFGDVNRYAATGGVIVQLWHGIPLKRIGLDAAVTTASPLPFARGIAPRVLGALYRRTQHRIRVLPAASELVRGRLESAFGLDTRRVPVTGEPRTDTLSQGTAADRRLAARARLGALLADAPGVGGYTPIVLYAPTWRDGAPDPAPPTGVELAGLQTLLAETGAVLLVRSHHLGGGGGPLEGPRVHGFGSEVVADITPLLPGIDALVTDYSSLAFDAALAGVPTLFHAPDLAAYERSRGFYGAYADVAGDDAASDWATLLAQLRALLTDPSVRAERVRRGDALSARVHAFRDGRNTERVYRAIRHLVTFTERVS